MLREIQQYNVYFSFFDFVFTLYSVFNIQSLTLFKLITFFSPYNILTIIQIICIMYMNKIKYDLASGWYLIFVQKLRVYKFLQKYIEINTLKYVKCFTETVYSWT